MFASQFSKSILIAGALLTAASFSTASHAMRWGSAIQPLSGADTLLTTYVSKSKIAGALEKDADGNLIMDAEGNFNFTFDGDIYYPITSATDGKLLATSGPIGTVAGTVLFPQEFAQLAFGAYAFMTGQGPLPPIPPVIHWKMRNIKIVDGGTTYVPLGDGSENMASAPEELGLYGRAFTGLGPVEMGQLDVDGDGNPDMSMSVRMGGCFAVQAIEGVEAGKIGTYCLNSTFTFDLSGIILDPASMMQSTITGIGSSNCTTVVQTPMQMPQ